MKKLYFILSTMLVSVIPTFANDYIVSISGFAYSPSTLTVSTGDQVTIEASSLHPLVQVDKSTWSSNGNTSLTGGWGTKTANYIFTTTNTDTIYYVCFNHVASYGMKGKIIVKQSTNNLYENSETSIFSISPIPADSKITLHLNLSSTSELTLSIFNINGELVKVLPPASLSIGTNEYPADISDIQNGIYFFVISSDKGKQYRGKFIIAR